jgi:hypothetical protein
MLELVAYKAPPMEGNHVDDLAVVAAKGRRFSLKQ